MSKIHLPHGVPQAAPQIQFQDAPNQTPVVITQQTPTGAVVGCIGGATRFETMASRIAAGFASSPSGWTNAEIATKAVAVTRALLVEMAKPEPEDPREAVKPQDLT